MEVIHTFIHIFVYSLTKQTLFWVLGIHREQNSQILGLSGEENQSTSKHNKGRTNNWQEGVLTCWGGYVCYNVDGKSQAGLLVSKNC